MHLESSSEELCDNYLARVRENSKKALSSGYNSYLASKLSKSSLPGDTYYSMYETLSNPHNLQRTMHRYVDLKKRVMGIDDFRFFDRYFYMFNNGTRPVSYSQGREIIETSLKPLGEDYVDLFRKGSNPDNGWVDIYPKPGKLYFEGSFSTYGVHPFVLLNYQNSYEDLFFAAHEFGHAIHFEITNRNYPAVYSVPVIFTTEIAAALNELLLYDYLIKETKNKKDKLFHLSSKLEFLRLRFMTTTINSEFERRVEEMMSSGSVPAYEDLKSEYASILEKFWGPDYVKGENDGAEWALNVNLYPSYYVFNYSASLVVALEFFKKFKENPKQAQKDYLKFLESGFHEDPLDTIEKSGIHLKTYSDFRQAIERSLDYFVSTMDEIEDNLG